MQFCEVAPDVVLVDLRLRDTTVAVDHYNLREADAETEILQRRLRISSAGTRSLTIDLIAD